MTKHSSGLYSLLRQCTFNNMFLSKFTIILLCFTIAVLSNDSCENWMDHENFHLVHSGGACGQVKIKDQDQLTTKILNGKTTTPGSLPWMAFIVSHYENKGEISICGGSVINENYILTAAHCFDNSTSSTVYLGLHNTQCVYRGCDYSLGEKYHVEKFIRHPQYDRKSLYNDIALLRVDRSISFESPYINYICLPTKCELSNKNLLGENLTIAGWGDIDEVQGAANLQRTVVSVAECRYYRTGESVVYSPLPSQLCVEGRDTMACAGDSGGPLTYNTANRVVQVGVASGGFASTCTLDTKLGTLGVFTRLTSFMPWILDNIEP